VFCRLLDAAKGGTFRVSPVTRFSSSRSYDGDTNVLATTFYSGAGRFRLTDFMPVRRSAGRKQGKDLAGGRRIVRLIEGLSGVSQVAVVFHPTFDFARAETQITVKAGSVTARAGNEVLHLRCSGADFHTHPGCGAEAILDIPEGVRVWLVLAYGDERPFDPEAALRATLDYWKRWSARCCFAGTYGDLVKRSALVLKLLTFSPTGALIAAPTTSLPESIGGVRNWDYRYTWLRDSSLILSALESIGYYEEAVSFFEWLEDLELRDRGRFQTMYAVDGREDLTEKTLDHLEGYRGSRPVRIGNRASTYVQLDIYGEVVDAAYLCLKRLKRKPRPKMWALLRELADHAAARWCEQDRSIWEVRGRPQDFLYSKLMCWVALDRAIQVAQELSLQGDVDSWKRNRDEIRAAILTKGYSERAGAFTQAFGSDALDASALLIPRLGFLPAGDPRLCSTVRAISDKLTKKGLVYRYRPEEVDDGLPGSEGLFTFCSFWLVDCLAEQGRVDEARELFERIVAHASDLAGVYLEAGKDTGK
jgi:alpha,alpha-trehalase